jgi:hypothetical protein
MNLADTLFLTTVDSCDQLAPLFEEPQSADEAIAYDANLCGEWISAKLAGSEKQHELLTELEWLRQGAQPEASEPLYRW